MVELGQRRQQRQEAIRHQTEQTRSQLQKLRQERAVRRSLDECSRSEAAAQRAKSVAESLARLEQERAAQLEVSRQQLQAFRANLTAAVEHLLSTYTQARQAMADKTQQARQSFCADLRQWVQALRQMARQELAQMAQEQQAQAQALRGSLATFRAELHKQVWGNGIPDLIPEPEVSISGEGSGSSVEIAGEAPISASDSTPIAKDQAPVEPPAPVSVPQPQPSEGLITPEPPEVPPRAEEQADPILAYVNNYVSALQAQDPNLTLLQVIGDRERVRDLLARGAVDLGVDPSEILATLRRMVSGAVAV